MDRTQRGKVVRSCRRELPYIRRNGNGAFHCRQVHPNTQAYVYCTNRVAHLVDDCDVEAHLDAFRVVLPPAVSHQTRRDERQHCARTRFAGGLVQLGRHVDQPAAAQRMQRCHLAHRLGLVRFEPHHLVARRLHSPTQRDEPAAQPLARHVVEVGRHNVRARARGCPGHLHYPRDCAADRRSQAAVLVQGIALRLHQTNGMRQAQLEQLRLALH
eukprot:3625186-Pleurochrysis_carterae.AAC.2